MKHINKNLILQSSFYFFIFIIFINSNCIGLRGNFDYTPKGKAVLEKKGILKLAITPFSDLRKADSTIYRTTAIFPLILWGTDTKDRPESDYYIFYPREQIPEAIQKEFQARNVFSEVKISERMNPQESDYIVKGEILSTKGNFRLILYGLNIAWTEYEFLPLLFLLGLPSNHSEFSLKVRLEFVERKTNKILFSNEYEKSEVNWGGFILYYGGFNFNHGGSHLAGQIIPDFVKSSLHSIGIGVDKK